MMKKSGRGGGMICWATWHLCEQILHNVVKYPDLYKYRKLHIKHPTLVKEFFPHDFCIELLEWVGFRRRGEYIILSRSEKLKRVKDALKRIKVLDEEWFDGEYP